MLANVITDFTDRNTCVLFGDGAGAVVLKACDPPRGVVDLFLRCDGSLSDYIVQEGGGSRRPASHETVDEKLHNIHMKGRKVYVNASKAMAEAVVGDDVSGEDWGFEVGTNMVARFGRSVWFGPLHMLQGQ